jgi:hypothetical protein
MAFDTSLVNRERALSCSPAFSKNFMRDDVNVVRYMWGVITPRQLAMGIVSNTVGNSQSRTSKLLAVANISDLKIFLSLPFVYSLAQGVLS